MRIEALRKLAGKEEIDYQFLTSALQGYADPRQKISSWLRTGELVRVKKGLYIFGESVALEPYSKEVLANLIFGPSAISLTYALSYYGLIPERVNIVTSVTNNRAKSFATPIGEFKYYYLHPRKYSVGIVINSVTEHQSFLMASPEKAICDQIHLVDNSYPLINMDDIENYLLHYLRMDKKALSKFKLTKIQEICHAYHNHKLVLLYDYLKTS
jgi:hypothetical protein